MIQDRIHTKKKIKFWNHEIIVFQSLIFLNLWGFSTCNRLPFSPAYIVKTPVPLSAKFFFFVVNLWKIFCLLWERNILFFFVLFLDFDTSIWRDRITNCSFFLFIWPFLKLCRYKLRESHFLILKSYSASDFLPHEFLGSISL